MDGEVLLILLIVAAAIGLVVYLASRSSKPTPPASPTVTTTMRTGTSTGAPVVRYPQNIPQPDPVIPVFEDRMVRQVRRCPSCDGENPIHAQGCEICGRRL